MSRSVHGGWVSTLRASLAWTFSHESAREFKPVARRLASLDESDDVRSAAPAGPEGGRAARVIDQPGPLPGPPSVGWVVAPGVGVAYQVGVGVGYVPGAAVAGAVGVG